MKRYAIILLPALSMLSLPSRAQFYVQSSASFFISATAQVSIDGLTLTPSSAITLSDFTLSRSGIPIPTPPPGKQSLGRVYNLSSPINFAGTLGISYLEGELNGITESTLQIATRSTAAQSFSLSSNTTVNPYNNYLSAAFTSSVTLGQVTAFGEAGALPVTLVNFQARAENSTAQLSWSTSEELNASHFEIEHSADASNWITVGQITAGEGNANTLRQYNFTHSTPNPGMNYYRLRMVDLDGTSEYSEIRQLLLNKIREIEIFPNPVKSTLHVRAATWEKISEIQILNMQGNVVYRSNGRPQSSIDLRHVSPGMYILRIQSDRKENYRFIVSP